MIETKFFHEGICEIESVGSWPEKAWDDIINIKIKLFEKGLFEPEMILIGPKHILNNLDAMIPGTACTIATALIDNGLLKKIIRVESDEDFLIVFARSDNIVFPNISSFSTAVKITGVNSLRNRGLKGSANNE